MSENVIYSINGPVVKVKDSTDFSMMEKVFVGHQRLMGEVISISREATVIQVRRPHEPERPRLPEAEHHGF